MSLTEIAVKNAKPRAKQYKLTDGLGLFLLITPKGGRYWRLKYRFGGKEKLLALGTYPTVSLKSARELRDDARALLAGGEDPGALKQAARTGTLHNAFEVIAREFAKNQTGARWTAKHAAEIIHRLEMYIFPHLGHRPISQITAPELLTAIRKMEARGATHITHRMVQTCGQVFRYGIATGRCSHNVSADLRGALVPRAERHMPAIEPKELPKLLAAISAYDGCSVTRLGLKFLALTFARTSEQIAAEWAEFSAVGAVWTIPGPRMKMKDEHLVPLSRQALAVLGRLRELNGDSQFVFAGSNRKKHMSNNTLLYALYRLGYHSRMTGHGFRAVASTILNEARERGEHNFGEDVIERQLAHNERNKVRAAYNRAKYIQERTAMMQWWADFLDQQAGGQFFNPNR